MRATPEATPIVSVALKSPEDIAMMRVAGRLAAELLDHIAPHVQPGVTTGELDRIAHDHQVNVQHVVPATLNYAPPGHRPYPASICTSVNHVVCHGIPGDKKLKPGDIVNIDVTVIKDGWHGRSAGCSMSARRRSRQCLVEPPSGDGGASASSSRRQAGRHSHDQQFAEGHHFSVVREFCGHGIGRQFHEDPQVLHYGRPGTGLELEPGMVFTIEPMINAGRAAIRALADGWTIVTADHALSAQWEHTIVVTADGHEVLTTSPGMPPPPPA
jgi:methionyl aminopeptidase